MQLAFSSRSMHRTLTKTPFPGRVNHSLIQSGATRQGWGVLYHAAVNKTALILYGDDLKDIYEH